MFTSFDVRLHSISIEHLKNVAHGEIRLTNSSTLSRANILGLYGQNGSGKTALIDALSIFQFAVANRKLPAEFADQISADSNYSHLSFVFHLSNGTDLYTVTYECKLRAEKEEDGAGVATSSHVVIFDEVLSYAFENETEKTRKTRIIDTTCIDIPFAPRSKFKTLTGGGQKLAMALSFEKGSQQNQSKSFVFSPRLRDIFKERLNSESIDQEERDEINLTIALLDRFCQYATMELFIVTSQASNLLGLDTLVLGFRLNESNRLMSGQLPIGLKTSVIPTAYLSLIRSVLDKVNIVLQEIIPGLTVGIRELDRELTSDNRDGVSIQLVSVRNHKEIPLKYESEGIKKIISVLSLFIALYNKRSITVAIDELDSGIFEYLLGELLRILAEKGKGQLIFTCHNLRPLETLSQEFIAFTSTDPENRYKRLPAIKATNNLRDVFYREIMVGDDTLYSRTRNPEISWAFRKAWEGES